MSTAPPPVLPDGVVEGPALRSDLDAIAALESAEFPVPWRRDYFAQELQQPQRYNRVLRRIGGDDDGVPEVLGYLFAAYLLDEMHINKIATRREWWGFGLARHMMERSLEFGAARGVRLVTLEVRTNNERAIDFYHRQGFDSVYIRRSYYQDGGDALVMHRELS